MTTTATSQTEALHSLSQQPKWLSPVWLYDQRGSVLFSKITQLPEYYPTGTELAIWRDNIAAITACLGAQPLLIEHGAGDSFKSRVLLDALSPPAAYIPCDISREFLLKSAEQLRLRYPQLQIEPVVAEFHDHFTVPKLKFTPQQTTVLLSGSTIGNFVFPEAVGLLRALKQQSGDTGQVLLGVDLIKDVDVLLAAYNDQQGVTAEFNLNVLRHLNRVADCNFDRANFIHRAVYDWQNSRIVMQLVSLTDQTVAIGGTEVELLRDEPIITEYSHKYSEAKIAELAESAGLSVAETWKDKNAYFSINLLK